MVFCFKQKTAYEMRISDWSSDVCSSDLEYEWGVHIAIFAGKAGLSGDEIAALLAVPADLSHWSTSEAALIAAVDALHERSTLSKDEFSALEVEFDRDQILEIILLAGFYRTVSYPANGLDMALEDRQSVGEGKGVQIRANLGV